MVEALLLGLLEGLTEFIPVSSTGHLLIAREFVGFRGPPGFVFEVVIQLGAILAICWIYRARLFRMLSGGLAGDVQSRRLALAILLAFVPAMVIGALGHSFIKDTLFRDLPLVCLMLVAGGVAILVIEKVVPPPVVRDMEQISLRRALGIGCIQVLAMVPGVSRSGATVMGGMLLGLDRKTAAEFSFWLAIPTMLGAATLGLYMNRNVLTADGLELIAAGFVAAFLAAMVVVRLVIALIQRHGYRPFAWYRIVLGSLVLVFLLARNHTFV
ncbi:MAG: undecaprenyl-diphosphate phosphatase [Pseudomonadota bacterium]|nr:undecaprenyl-diphosphate phosphatase [Pseudomonadota bacterium]